MTPSARQFGTFFLLPFTDVQEALDFISSNKRSVTVIKNLSAYLARLSCKYLLLVDAEKDISIRESSLRHFLKPFTDQHTGMVYSDFTSKKRNLLKKHPVIDYQAGSIREDFNFGSLLIFSVDAVRTVLQKYGASPSDPDVALYDLRLKTSADYHIRHVRKFLYTVSVKNHKQLAASGGKAETHFAYVAKENFLRQKKLEKIATHHLKRIGAYLPSRTKIVNNEQDGGQWKASIVIPVRNRKKMIADALKSALKQKTDFPFNVIVVDNHSTDGTTDILRKFASTYPHMHHLIPSRRDLGIGGCWNGAIYSPYCGRYVVQLDSDDLYSSPHTLQKVVNKLRRGRYAMVVGSYTIVDEHLKKIPPGLIAHKEWTQTNGHNNLLRVNGMGAPRAFDRSVICRTGFPNVSYGEDYAVALRITREYKIGRIYENLYWCRRWKDNTDAGLDAEKKNRNDFYKDQLRTLEIEARKSANKGDACVNSRRVLAEFSGGKALALPFLCQHLYDAQKKTWPKLAEACRNLASVHKRKLPGAYDVYLQYNPARAISSGASVDAQSIRQRPCFLCQENLPVEQKGILYRSQYLILCNPAPIFEKHFTIVSLQHTLQEITSSINGFLQLSADMSGYAVFYNGPACGASAPDHLHFQAVPKKFLPFLREIKKLPVCDTSSLRYVSGETFDRSVVLLESGDQDALSMQFETLLKALQSIMQTKVEPMVNVVCDHAGHRWRLIVFLRQKHRPDAYFEKGEKRIFISPGAVDMAGVVITPLLDNYNRLDYNAVREIYRDVSLSENTTDAVIRKL